MKVCFIKRIIVVIWPILWVFYPSIAQEKVYNSWEDLFNTKGSKYFIADISRMHSKNDFTNDHPWLSEELLFVQSNSRILVCQNPRGELRFAAMPTQVYPVPTNRGIPNGPNYGPGMYYHFDAVRLLNLKFTFKADGSDVSESLIDENQRNSTFYADYFLPLTRGKLKDIESTIISLAPVSDDPENSALSPAPLPGPPGALYLLLIKNTGRHTVKGSVELSCEKKLHNQDTQKNIDRNTLVLTIPEGSAGIHMAGGTWSEDQSHYLASRAINIEPGELVLIESYIILGEKYKDIMPVLYRFYIREPLDWLNLTAQFWNERMGRLTVGSNAYSQMADISREIYCRCIIDNFCCLQADSEGNLLAHYQGVPKQGTIWGIDYEPTIISAMHIAPELGKAGIKFTMTRNRPPRTEYGIEHSVPILISPVMIARKYLELTGDLNFFLDNSEVMESLDHTIRDLLTLKASDYTLFPTRYSSDGPVGRRFDHGTNVKVYYALDGYGYILDALENPEEAQHYYKLAEEVRDAIDQTMVINGPFGPQYSGGTNLGLDPGKFYLDDTIPYYDGEDTGSHLGPVYGIYGWNHEPWINYHRWARSLFCPWYEPEYGTMRWFPSWSMPVLDGTGWISTLGGCVTQAEMANNMEQLYKICDPSGSLYWWPFGFNFKQGLSRCSQGQGTWAWQYLEQWLGVRINALTRTLTFSPRGLPDKIEWEKMQIGNHCFDIAWLENEEGSSLEITNNNSESWTVNFGCRPFGTGITENLNWEKLIVEPGQTTLVELENSGMVEDYISEDNLIAKIEKDKLGDRDGIVFKRYGTIDPFPDWYHLWEEEALDLRFYIMNGTGNDWKKVSVTLEYPQGWMAQARKAGQWKKPDQMRSYSSTNMLGDLHAGEYAVAPFLFKGPYEIDHDFLTEGLSKHYPAEQWEGLRLPSKEINLQSKLQFKGILNAITEADVVISKELIVPLTIIPVIE